MTDLPGAVRPGPVVACGRGNEAAVAGRWTRVSPATMWPGGIGHRGFAPSGVAERPWGDPEAAPEGLDEV